MTRTETLQHALANDRTSSKTVESKPRYHTANVTNVTRESKISHSRRPRSRFVVIGQRL